MENNEVKKTEAAEKKEKLVDIGVVPYDAENPANKYMMISVNGESISVERGTRQKVPERFANAYEHRMKMAGRKIKERERRAQELRDKQKSEGVSFL